jgi:hypothetical protein
MGLVFFFSFGNFVQVQGTTRIARDDNCFLGIVMTQYYKICDIGLL